MERIMRGMIGKTKVLGDSRKREEGEQQVGETRMGYMDSRKDEEVEGMKEHRGRTGRKRKEETAGMASSS